MSSVFLTPRFAAIALLGAGPAALLGLVGVPVLAALGGWAALCGLAAAADIALTPSPRRVEVSRRGPATALRDEPVRMLIGLRNLGTREIRGAVQDTWPKHALVRAGAHPSGGEGAGSASSPWIPVVAAPGEPLSIPFALAPRRRGTLRSGYIAVRARGPLGLAGRETRHPLPGTISVSWRPRRTSRAVTDARPAPDLAAEHLRAIDAANGATLARALDELRFFAGLYGGSGAVPADGAAIPLIGAVSEYLPRLTGRETGPDRSGRLRPLLGHLSDLFARAQQGPEQQQRLLVSRYAETLAKLASLLSEDYYGDLLRNPGYWSDPEQRIAQVLRAVEAVDHEVVENIRQLSESRDIEFRVALESLTRPQNGARLSDVYRDREP